MHAVKAQRMDAVRAFFADYGDQLMAGPEAPDWAPWFALPYVAAPAAHPALAAFFGAEWGALTEAAFRNFLAEVNACMRDIKPVRPPGLMRTRLLVHYQEHQGGHRAHENSP